MSCEKNSTKAPAFD